MSTNPSPAPAPARATFDTTTHSHRAHVLGIVIAAMAMSVACDIHDGFFDPDEEFNAGGADPYNFPPAYRGTGQARERAASGVFTEVGAFSKGRPVGYFQFPFGPSQVTTTGYAAPAPTSWPEGNIDPLRVTGPGTNFRQSVGNPAPVPLVYNFDPPGDTNPFVPVARCAGPGADYVQDRRWEGVPANEQWNVFTFLPDRFSQFPIGGLPTWSYRPVVAEVPVTTADIECQSVKSERTLLKRADEGKLQVPRGEPELDKRIGRLGAPTAGRFLAWALIDPGAAVVRVNQRVDVLQGGPVTGTSVQKYGWYGQFIVAYIDGGYIPVEDGPRVAGAPTTRMRTQRIYYPRSDVARTGSTAPPAPGTLGAGFDVLQADRFEGDGAGYSPVCEVWTYALPGVTKQADLPTDEQTILARANSTLEPARTAQPATQYLPSSTVTPRYVFCLQAAPRVATP